MATLGVVTIVLNEEHNIAGCLESVQWADQLLVVDTGSVDGTMATARKFTDHVLSLPWQGYGATKNAALAHVTTDWVLWLDADERVPVELANDIKAIISVGKPAVDAYDVARRAYFLGRWIRHSGWYPGRVTRLFRKGKGRFTETRVHERLIVDGTTGSLSHDLLHFTDPNLYHYGWKFNRYTSLAAEDLHASGRSFSFSDLIFRPAFQFFKMFVVRRGVLDGMPGLILAMLSSAYVFVKYAKLWELQKPR